MFPKVIRSSKIGTENHSKNEAYSAINIFRLTLFFCFVATTFAGGYFAYTTLASYEYKAALISFDATADHMKSYSWRSFDSKMSSIRTIHTYLKTKCPSLDYWPFCTTSINDYDTMADSLISMADIAKFNHECNVFPEEITDFVKAAVNFYNTSGYPDVAQIVSKGIFGTTDDGVVNMITQPVEGENYLIAVILQISYPRLNSGALMFDIYSGSARISTIDTILACVKSFDRVHSSLTALEIASRCTVTTPILALVEDLTNRPASILMSPVLLPLDDVTRQSMSPLRRNRTVMVNKDDETLIHVGSTSVVFHWDEMLSHAVFPSTDGLEVVLSDGLQSQVFTYKNGVAMYRKGASIDKAKDTKPYQRSFPISFLENGDTSFTLTVKMDETFANSHRTNAPVIGSLITVAVIVVSFLQFVIYDYLVAKKSAEQEQARKTYVRYISHGKRVRRVTWSYLTAYYFHDMFVVVTCVYVSEIRTPLTTVSLGVKFVQRKLKELLRHREIQVTTSPTVTVSLRGPRRAEESDLAEDVPLQSQISESSEELRLVDMIDMLSSVDSSTSTAIRILNDLLNYDKIKSTGLQLDVELFDPWSMIQSVAGGFQVQAREKGVNLRLDLELVDNDFHAIGNDGNNYQELMESLVVNGDRLKLEQVARNLISNALKFTPSGKEIVVLGKKALCCHVVRMSLLHFPFIRNPSSGCVLRCI